MKILLLAMALTPEAQNLQLRREMTGLGYAPEVTVVSILDYVQKKRGAQGPIFQDEEKPQQLVLIDADGKRWTSETDGGVIEIRDESGRHPLVFETKTKWFKANETDRMLLSLEALMAAGARPDYRYGGGHIKIKLKPHFENHPLQLASLVNLFLKYEPILVHLMMHERRTENAKPLFSIRVAQYLGQGLNEIINNKDCRQDPDVKRRYDQEAKANFTIQENCVLAWLAHFALDVVGSRNTSINLQSWRGAPGSQRVQDALEFRFFNAPTNLYEATLEEALVRRMADQAIRADKPILYEQLVDPAYDLNSFYHSYFPHRRNSDFLELLKTSGFNENEIKAYFNEYLDATKSTQRRTGNI